MKFIGIKYVVDIGQMKNEQKIGSLWDPFKNMSGDHEAAFNFDLKFWSVRKDLIIFMIKT